MIGQLDVIDARVISGCRRELTDVVVFAPLLLLGIALGLGLLTLNFWMASWKPTLLSGCFSIIMFAASPAAAWWLWMNWRTSSHAADARLTLHEVGLKIQSLREPDQSQLIYWSQIERCRIRKITVKHRSLQITFHDSSGPASRTTVDLALCADVGAASSFAMELNRRIALDQGIR